METARVLTWAGMGALVALGAIALLDRPQWPPGPIVEGAPEQGELIAGDRRPRASFEGFAIEGLASYRITARVLSVKDYDDEMAPVVPRDAALGWGRMSDEDVFERLDVSQGERWYSYRWGPEGPPIPAGEIITSSANTHLLAIDPDVRRQVGRIKENDKVTLTGWLAHLTSPQGHGVRSSLSRRDTGDGACELLWITAVEIQAP